MPIETSAPPAPIADAVPALMYTLRSRRAHVGIIGMGYVGLPAALSAARAGFTVTGFDVDEAKVDALRGGESFLSHIPSCAVANALHEGRFVVAANFERLPACDAILICVPTPLTKHREPDLSFVVEAARTIAACLRPGQLVVLESTTYPGTTEEVVKPILERTGLKSGTDFFLPTHRSGKIPATPRSARPRSRVSSAATGRTRSRSPKRFTTSWWSRRSRSRHRLWQRPQN